MRRYTVPSPPGSARPSPKTSGPNDSHSLASGDSKPRYPRALIFTVSSCCGRSQRGYVFEGEVTAVRSDGPGTGLGAEQLEPGFRVVVVLSGLHPSRTGWHRAERPRLVGAKDLHRLGAARDLHR